MAVYQKEEKVIGYCHKIRELCLNESDSAEFSKRLLEILKNLNRIKQEARLKFSIYVIEKSKEE